jgi:hypothetical protein
MEEINSKEHNTTIIENIFDANKQITFKYQILYKRIYGKKLAFLTGLNETNKEMTVILKDPELILSTKMGDVVIVEGGYKKYKDNCDFIASKIHTIENSEIDGVLQQKRRLLHTSTIKKEEEKALCRKIRQGKICQNELCIFRHNLSTQELDKLHILKKRQEETFLKDHENDPLDKHSKFKKIKRNEFFAKFLVDTFGLENLKKGYIIDVAGGKGNLNLILFNYYRTSII